MFYHHAEMNDPIMQHDCEKLQEKINNEDTVYQMVHSLDLNT